MSATKRATRTPTPATVLGKRASSESSDDADGLPTPEDTPKAKRARTSVGSDDEPRANKENIPPSRAASPLPRAFTRTATEASVGRTPRSLHRTTTGWLPSTPSSAFAGLSIGTPPTTPSALVPLHVRARGLLRATCNSTSAIAGRDDERTTIASFLHSFAAGTEEDADNAGVSTLYVSGLPGTGKTALVNDILRGMEAEMDGVVLITLNCMALNSADALWDRLQEELGVMKKTKARGRPKKLDVQMSVAKILESSSTKCVLILDELDHISASAGSLTSLFTLAHANRHSLRVVGIANTHTLTAAGALFAGVPGVRTLHFAAYAAPALEAIVRARLAPLYTAAAPAMAALLPPAALGLLARKVAAQTGDVRAAFEVLRGAIDAAVLAAPVTAAPAVTPAHVLSALKLYAPAAAAPTTAGASTGAGTSQLAAQVRTLGLQQRLVLLALVLAGQRAAAGLPLTGGTAPPPPKSPSKRAARAGAGGPDAGALHAFYAALLARAGGALSAPLPRGAFRDVLGLLETAGLVALPAPAPGRGAAKGAQDVRLAAGVRADEVLRGLGCAGAPAEGEDAREEEVRAICAQEQARVAREVRARAAAAGVVDAFAEASED